MKRKFLSTLLMGALFIASVSVLTSCKDYDDDIKDVNESVATLRADLEKQIKALDDAQKTCCDGVKARLDAAEEALKALEGSVSKDDMNAAIQAAINGYDEEVAKNFDAKVLAAVTEFVNAQAAAAAATAKSEALGEAKAYADGLMEKLNFDGKVGAEAFAELAAQFATLSGKVSGIDEALNKVGGINTRLEAVEGAIQNLNVQQATTEALEAALKEKFGENFDFAKLKEIVAGYDKQLDQVKKDYDKAIEDAIKALKEELAGGEDASALLNRLKKVEDTIKDDVVTKESLSETMTQLNDDIENAIGVAVAPLNTIQFLIAKQLTSIVLKPEFYYSGIEAVELPALYDTQWKNYGEELTLAEDWAKNVDASPIDICKGGVAWYHLNPYTANLDGSKISFISNIAQTRAAEDDADITLITPKNDDSWKWEGNANKSKLYPGLVKVEFDGSFDQIDALLRAGRLPMVALKYQQEVTTGEGEDAKTTNIDLNSDWALVAPTQYKDLLVADVLFQEKHNNDITVPDNGHLTRELVDLADAATPATHFVKYDKSFNLTKAVATHFTYSYRNGAGVEVTAADQIMDPEVFKAFGLKYQFDPVTYYSGNNTTNESVHINIETNEDGDVVARPVLVQIDPENPADGVKVQAKDEDGKPVVDEDGNPVYEQADHSSVGRQPIIRVLIKTADDKVAAYAYLKLEISEYEEETPVDGDIEQKFEQDFYVDCDNEDYNGKLSWIQVQYPILHDALGGAYSKTTFEQKWTLVGYSKVIAEADGDAEDADQFAAKGDATPTTKFGKVQLVQDEGQQHMQVIKWQITHAEIMDKFVNADGTLKNVDETGASTIDFTVWVKFEGPKNVWVKLYIPKGKFHFAVGSVDDNKLAYNWYALNSANEGKKETHANVVVPNTRNDDCIFEWDLLAAFDEGKISASPDKVDGAQKFPEFAAHAQLSLQFTTPSKSTKDNAAFEASKIGNFEDAWIVKGMSGTQYVLQLNAALDEVLIVARMQGTDVVAYATPIWVCKIEDGKIAGLKSKMTYNQENEPLDILNYKGHLQLGDRETFTAYLRIALKDCYYMIMKNKSEYFNVRFLRPVDMDPTLDKTIQDAVTGGSIINVMDLVTLTDWRGEKFSANIKDADGTQASVAYKNYNTAQWVNDPWEDWTTKGTFNFTAADDQKANPHFIRYYNVVEIAADVDNTRYDGHLSDAERVLLDPKTQIAQIEALKKLKVSATELTYEYTAPTAGITWDGSKFVGGEIFYANNTGTGRNFHIYVPLTITYKWGPKEEAMKQHCWGVITVKKTLGQAKQF